MSTKRLNGGVDRFIKKFDDIGKETDEKLKKNPYSKTYEEPEYDTNAIDYARPTKGSLTEKRGIKAGLDVLNQVIFLCELICKHGEGPDESKVIRFGPLFKIYEFYSDSVVGWLIRARKYGLLHFEGEMLYQRQDDNKPITMLMSIDEIRTTIKFSGDPKNIIQLQQKENKPKLEIAPEKPKEDKPKAPKTSNKVQEAKKSFAPAVPPKSSYYNFCT